MEVLCLEVKIDKLQSIACTLLRMGQNRRYIYADDLFLFNNEINELINDLYPYRGITIEQEFALCLALLRGYSVSINANPNDEEKKRNVLARTRIVLRNLSSSSLKEQLLSVYNELRVI